MAAAVDRFSAVEAAKSPCADPAAVFGAAASDFSCNACGETFEGALEQRAHCKTERHVYNTKRRLAGLKPISMEAWERKLKETRGSAAGAPNKGTAHLKAGKVGSKHHSNEQRLPTEQDAAAQAPPKEEEEVPFSPRRCLFDKTRHENLDDNLQYMRRTYDFYIPDREYCTDVEGLLKRLWERIQDEPHGCLYCNKKFADASSCRAHMLDKRHARIGSEARTRKGNVDEMGSEQLKAELEEFYDFHHSTREVTERIQEPAERVGCLLRFFDADRDGRLDREELSELWTAAKASNAEEGTGGELSDAMYVGACKAAGADPSEGLDQEALLSLYMQGLADLDKHFKVLQDLLAAKLRKRAQDREQILEENEDEAEEGEEEDDASDAGEESEEEDDESDVEVLECDDEDEFEEVMRILGLQRATLRENGDLQLPNGSSAVHRDVAYIWKQRGRRVGQLALRGKPYSFKPRTAPMLTNSDAGLKVAFSRRQQACEGKRVVAVLRHRQHEMMKLGMKHNNMQRKCLKIRTGFGDASGGR